MVDNNSLEEIVIPSIIMVALFLINFIILFVIYRYKKRIFYGPDDDELGTLPVSTDKETTT